MNDTEIVSERPQTGSEEIANSISHGLGLLASLIGAPFLIVRAIREGDTKILIGASIFAATIVLLYLTSTLYHALPRGRAKHVFRLIEHKAIFLLIAGTYTPFTLGVLRGTVGWTLFGVIWALAGIGILLKLIRGVRHPILSTLLYVGMGWSVLFAIRPLAQLLPLAGMLWIVAGGLAYTLGVPFYVSDRRRYFHFIWHLFVLAGTTCHFFAVLWYAV